MNEEPLPDMWELEEQVDSKTSFLRFLDALIADWHDSQEKEKKSPSSPYGPKANDWENSDLGSFLQAMRYWAITKYAETGELNVPEKPSWKSFAKMLAAAKIYE